MNKAKRKGYIPFAAGMLAVLIMMIPYLVLGEDAVVTYHDQLDGEMLAYIFQAKYLFQNTIIPEFMGGMEKTALVAPAPMCILLFCFGHYFAAYVFMQMAGAVTGYAGMYLLAKEETENPVIAMLVGVMFAYLPFRPVYGLSQYGIPMLIWCLYQLRKGHKKIICYAYTILYALNSSLILVGFAVLGVLAIAILISAWRKKNCKGILIAWFTMLCIYILENLNLLRQILRLSDNELISHKTEYLLGTESVSANWFHAFWEGGQHSEDFHYMIVILVVPVLLIWWKSWKGKSIKIDRLVRRSVLLLFCILSLCFLSALWNGHLGLLLREHISAFRGFQFERVLWLAPALWYLVFAGLLEVVWNGCRKESTLCRTAGKLFLVTVCTGCIILTGFFVFKESNLKVNLQAMLVKDYKAISYKDYYARDVMQQVKDFLKENTKKEPYQYRVVSLGMDPAAAYYSGFYCLDGYSNNYSLDYKHQFRKVLEPELLESDYLKEYYDGWGNRCYLFSSESPGYYTFEKFTSYFWNYKINTKALADMGGEYVLSALYLVDSQLQGLELMREEPFETPDSYYAIYLYEVIQE